MSQGKTSIDEVSRGEGGAGQRNRLHELIQSGHSFSGRERHCCFLNSRNGRFANVSRASGLDLPEDGRALSLVDWDHDGDLDCWIVNRSGPQVRLLRNDLPRTNRFIALLLQGVASNRDAIGARVELYVDGDPGQKIVRTVRAGSGYLSQSSKWLHFGLGGNGSIQRVTIRWPSGTVQHLDELRANRRYHVVEGKADAQTWTRPPVAVELLADTIVAGESTADWQVRNSNQSRAIRTVLASPVALPPLRFEQSDDTKVLSVSELESGHPILLTLWASWCGPCVSELQAFSERSEDWKKHRVRILALNVDGLTPTPQNTDVVKEMFERHSGKITFGTATEELVSRLQLVNNRLFDLDIDIPLPSSFLIDASGQLAAIYKGTVDARLLLTDVEQLQTSPEQRRPLATPFPGRWSASAEKYRLLYVALDLVQEGPVSDALDYIEQHEIELSGDHQYHILLYNLGQQFTKLGDHGQATELYRRALRRKPGFGAALYNLGVTYSLQGQFSRAESFFRRALESNPNDVDTLLSLGRCLSRLGKLSEAINLFGRAAGQNPSRAECHYELSVVLALSGQIDAAVSRYQKATALDVKYRSDLSRNKFVAAGRLAADVVERQRPGSVRAREIRRRMGEFVEKLQLAEQP